MGKRLTNAEFLESLQNINPNLEPLEEYINYSTPILCRCKICGYESKLSPNNLFYGHGCKMCGIKSRADKRRITYEKFIERAKSREDFDEYFFHKDTYIAVNKHMLITHNCGHQYETTPAVFLEGCRCPICARRNMPHKYWTKERCEEYLNNLKMEGYTLVSFDYDADDIILRHESCGIEFHTCWHYVYYGGNRCPVQSCVNQKIKETLLKNHGVENAMWSPEIVEKRNQYFLNTYGSISPSSDPQVKERTKQTNIQLFGTASSSQRHYPDYLKRATYDDEYLLSLVDGINTYSELKDKYPLDYGIINALLCRVNKEFKPSISALEGCQSYPEYKIKKILESNHINFRMHYWFNECRWPSTNHVCYFDFAILDERDKIKCILEYDGEQHYELVTWWNDSEAKLKERQEADVFKTKFCETIGLPIYRIPYWEYEIIEQKLKEFNII